MLKEMRETRPVASEPVRQWEADQPDGPRPDRHGTPACRRYTDLVYNKGALVLRMLHFLFTDPSTLSGQPFFDMMSDFTRRFQGSSASTDDFRMVAGEHFAKTRIAQKYGIRDLDWFFGQWVLRHRAAELPARVLDRCGR